MHSWCMGGGGGLTSGEGMCLQTRASMLSEGGEGESTGDNKNESAPSAGSLPEGLQFGVWGYLGFRVSGSLVENRKLVIGRYKQLQ